MCKMRVKSVIYTHFTLVCTRVIKKPIYTCICMYFVIHVCSLSINQEFTKRLHVHTQRRETKSQHHTISGLSEIVYLYGLGYPQTVRKISGLIFTTALVVYMTAMVIHIEYFNCSTKYVLNMFISMYSSLTGIMRTHE